MATTSKLTSSFHADPRFVPGCCQTILKLHTVVERIARTEISVLLIGESGTGKEAYARLIHRLSARSHLPLKKLSCGAPELCELLPRLRIHSQTSSENSEQNLSTLFLDGVDELDLGGQKVLLSLLSNRDAGEIGERDFRLISTTSRNLQGEIGSGRFRHDLYFRISEVCLHLPPLRERREDIPSFVEYFLARHAQELQRQAPVLNEQDMELLTAYDWPGNIRELGNVARKMVALGNPKMAMADLSTGATVVTVNARSSETVSLKAAARAASRLAERQLILTALERTHWNRKHAAQQLQISYKSLLCKIKQTGVGGTKVREQ